VLIREARPDDLDAAAELEMGVIRHDAHVGTAIIRPATEALVREDTRKVLTEWPGWDTGRCGPSGRHARPSHWAAIANVSSDKH
jgi:hypothetical protein